MPNVRTPIFVIGGFPEVTFEKEEPGPPASMVKSLNVFQLTATVIYDTGQWWYTLILEQQGPDVPWSGEHVMQIARETQRDLAKKGAWLIETGIGPLQGHVEWHPIGAGWECRLRYPTVNGGNRFEIPIHYR